MAANRKGILDPVHFSHSYPDRLTGDLRSAAPITTESHAQAYSHRALQRIESPPILSAGFMATPVRYEKPSLPTNDVHHLIVISSDWRP